MRLIIRTIVLATLLSFLAPPITPNATAKGSDAVAPQPQGVTDTGPLAKLEALSFAVEALEESGQISSKKARSLQKKLRKVERALTGEVVRGDHDADNDGAVISGFTVQQFTGDIGAAIRALLDFIRELTQLVTELPSQVLQPLINAAIELLQELVSLLLG